VVCDLSSSGHATSAAPNVLAVSHDDGLLLSIAKQSAKVWTTRTMRPVRTMQLPTASQIGLCAIFVAGNDHIVVGLKDGSVALYDLASMDALQMDKAHGAAVQDIAPHPHHTGFASVGSDKVLKLYKFYVKKRTTPTGGEEGEGVGVETETVAFVDTMAHELNDEGMCVRYSPSCKFLAVGLLDSTTQIYYLNPGPSVKPFVTLYGHKLPITALDISTDSTLLVSASADKSVKLWGMDFGDCHTSFRAHTQAVTKARFLPDTHYFVTTGRDGCVKIWDGDARELITQLMSGGSAVTCVALSLDAAFFFTAGEDGGIRLWRRTSEQLFLEEERERELEQRMEQDAYTRDDMDTAAGGGEEVTLIRPTKRTLDSVRTAERLMEVIDEATEALTDQQQEQGDETMGGGSSSKPELAGRTAHEHVLWAVQQVPAPLLYEVLLSMPFSYALRLMQFIAAIAEAIDIMGGGYVCVERLSQTALLLVQLHTRQLVTSSAHRPLLLRLRDTLRPLLIKERDVLHFNTVALQLLEGKARNESSGSSSSQQDLSR